VSLAGHQLPSVGKVGILTLLCSAAAVVPARICSGKANQARLKSYQTLRFSILLPLVAAGS